MRVPVLKASALILVLASLLAPADLLAGEAERYLQAVRTFADGALEFGRDVYGPEHTPLFVDGLEVHTLKPVRWPAKDKVWIPANLASQQNLFRTLDGLTTLTGVPKYRRAAVEAIRFGFDRLQHPNGLLFWGGHTSYDALGDRAVTEAHQHELKRHYPYYPLMWQVDPKATHRFIEAFWAAHVQDWSNLDFNRHGDYKRPIGKLWKNEYAGGPVFFRSKGLTFVNTGSDLFYAAAMLRHLSGEEPPLVWAKRLARRYVETRNPKTGLGGYQFSQCHWPKDLAQRQFGPEFGDRIKASTLIDSLRAPTKFAYATTCQLMLGEMLGESGGEFLQWGLEDLQAYGRHAFNPGENTFTPFITDGTRLKPSDVKRPGYYGPPGTPNFEPLAADPRFLRAYALAWRLTGDPFCWKMARAIARGNELGDIGTGPGEKPSINLGTSCSDPYAIMALLQLHRRTGQSDYLKLACRVADNVLSRRFHHRLFVEGKDYRFTRLDRCEPLALLHLVAAMRGRAGVVPEHWPGEGYFACYYGEGGRKYDSDVIYPQRKQTAQ